MSVRSLNKVMIIGNLTRDPELRYTANGTSVATFGLATNRSWKDANGELQESTQFHNIVAWGKMAEICQQILAKGMMVYVEGELNTRSWEGDDGVTRYKTEIRIAEMKLLDDKGKQGVGGGGAAAEKPEDSDEADAPSDEKSSSDEKSEAPAKEKEKSEKSEDPLNDDEDLPF